MRIWPFKKKAETKAHQGDDFFSNEDLTLSGGFLPRTAYHYGQDIGHGLDSNVIMAPVSWVMRAFTEAQPIVESKRNNRWRRVDDHPVEQLLDVPNPWYDGDAMTKAIIISYLLDGNAYLLKRRSDIGTVLELWYAPHWMIQPVWPRDGSVFISHYLYRPSPSGIPQILLPRDVIHLRFALDPRNPRLGFSPLRPLMREIFTDEEASNFSASILKNQGFPGVIIAPKEGQTQTREEAQGLKDKFTEHFAGDNRGKPFVPSKAVDVTTIGFNPQQINLSALRDVTEERVCAMLGLPAAVAGFGAGMQQVKVGATMRELVRLARVNVIIPMGRTFSRVFTIQLLSDFVAQRRRFRVRYDMSEVSVFQEDENAREARILSRVAGGVMTVSDAQEALNMEVDETQDVYLRSSGVPVLADEVPLQTVPTNNRLNGNGGLVDDVATQT